MIIAVGRTQSNVIFGLVSTYTSYDDGTGLALGSAPRPDTHAAGARRFDYIT